VSFFLAPSQQIGRSICYYIGGSDAFFSAVKRTINFTVNEIPLVVGFLDDG
jgi:hypothetical protein